MNSTKSVNLPSHNYGPFCLKILKEFISHHGLSSDLPLPMPGLRTDQALSRIFDIMTHSLGEEKRTALLKELDEYNAGIKEATKTKIEIPKKSSLILP